MGVDGGLVQQPGEQRGGGRPPVGPAFSLRFPPDLLARVDAAAAAEGVSRAAWLRYAAEDRAWVPREELAGFVLWLLAEQAVEYSEVARVIEKPWAYRDWLQAYRAGGGLDEAEDATHRPGQVLELRAKT